MRALLAACAAALALSLAACAGSTPTPVYPSVTMAPAAKVDANTAPQADIAAAITAVGEDGNRWAGEVVEYRPYAADDTGLSKLRKELTKYADGPTIDKIVGTLKP